MSTRRRDTSNACGTDKGYHRHRRAREKACDACLDAHADATKEAKQRVADRIIEQYRKEGMVR